MKDPKRNPNAPQQPEVPPKPHEFPEYEDMPTDIHDDTGPERKQEQTPDHDRPEDPVARDEAADITNE